MSFRLLFDSEQRVLVVSFGKSLTQETLTAMRAAVKRFAEAEGKCRAIVDFLAVEEVNVPSSFIAEIARSGPVAGRAKRAIVAAKPEVFGLGRMYELAQAKREDEIIVVRTLAEAYAALGMRAPKLQPVEPDTPA